MWNSYIIWTTSAAVRDAWKSKGLKASLLKYLVPFHDSDKLSNGWKSKAQAKQGKNKISTTHKVYFNVLKLAKILKIETGL